MPRIFSRAMLAITCLTLLSGGMTPAAHAQECSASQVAGKWAFWTHGNVIGIGPRVSAGIFTLDHSGNLLHAQATSSLNGAVTDELFFGRYSVNPDCTGALSVLITDTSGNPLFTVTLAAYFDDGGHEMRGVFSSVALAADGSPLATSIVFEGRKTGDE